jgi:hypothetical protein
MRHLGLGNAPGHRGYGCLVQDDLYPLTEPADRARVTHISINPLHLFKNISDPLLAPRGIVIENADLHAALDEPADQMGANEATTTSDQVHTICLSQPVETLLMLALNWFRRPL